MPVGADLNNLILVCLILISCQLAQEVMCTHSQGTAIVQLILDFIGQLAFI